MTRSLRQVATLVAKDLRLEARTRQTVGLVVVLAILIVAVLGLGLGPEQLASGYAAPAVLWVAYLFAGVLCFEKTMAMERHDGALAALLLAPVDRAVIYFAKLISNLILMFTIALVVTPVALVLFGFDLSAAPLGFAVTVGVSMIGFAAVGTLFSAAVSSTGSRGGPLAMVIFPITLPLVLASTHLLVKLFRDGQPIGGTAMLILVAFGLIYLVVSWLVFELILEP
jgi:heme exporter protein B